MKIDLFHNKIVADTMTPEFDESFRRYLVPMLTDRFGEIDGIQMYEDYIADGFSADCYWYYPLTVLKGGEANTVWIRWPFIEKEYEDGVPYSFVGPRMLFFEICDEIPEGFEEKLAGRARYCEDNAIKVRIETVGGDPTLLSGKYSQTFIDEMARQLTPAIEAATGVSGLAESSVELTMVFASGTFMEHISDNVTYRRLLLRDKVSAPRDFWVKWTRLDGAVSHSVSSHVSSETISFELGEDVEQKIREKEYRYLLASGNEKYHNSMGRKKVTEWREVIKRCAKRGELIKDEPDAELAPETIELEERIADMLGKRIANRDTEKKDELPNLHFSDEDAYERAMQKIRMVVDGVDSDSEDELSFSKLEEEITSDTEEKELVLDADEAEETDEVSEELEFTDDEDMKKLIEESEELINEASIVIREADELIARLEAEEQLLDEESYEQVTEQLVEYVNEEKTSDELNIELSVEAEEEETTEQEEESQLTELEEIDEPEETDEAVEEENTESILKENDDEKEEIEPEEKEVIEETVEAEEVTESLELTEEAEVQEEKTEEENSPVEEIAKSPVSESLADRVAEIRAEVETKIRLEYECKARMKAEEELVALRREREKLKIEKATLLAEAIKEQERLRNEYVRLLEETKRAQLQREAAEAQRRIEEEQLRVQIETQLRAEAKERERLAEAARMAIEEQHRLEAENARIAREREEEERIEAEKQRREQEERELEALRQAELERIRREDEEAKARARAAMPEMGDGRYSYTSKSVKLIFRRSVDPNITNRIYEIIKATVEYYGKERVYLKIRASVPDSQTVVLDFEHVPMEEMQLLGNIIKILGNSGLGIAKAIID